MNTLGVKNNNMSCITKLLWILILIIVSTIWIASQVSTVYGIPTTTLPLVVKITSPHKGQQVGISFYLFEMLYHTGYSSESHR